VVLLESLLLTPLLLLLQVYRILLRHTPVVQPLSCDEALFDISGLPGDPQEHVAQIRREIEEATSCTASAGVCTSNFTADVLLLLLIVITELADGDVTASKHSWLFLCFPGA
jgi:hypothetical protein